MKRMIVLRCWEWWCYWISFYFIWGPQQSLTDVYLSWSTWEIRERKMLSSQFYGLQYLRVRTDVVHDAFFKLTIFYLHMCTRLILQGGGWKSRKGTRETGEEASRGASREKEARAQEKEQEKSAEIGKMKYQYLDSCFSYLVLFAFIFHMCVCHCCCVRSLLFCDPTFEK